MMQHRRTTTRTTTAAMAATARTAAAQHMHKTAHLCHRKSKATMVVTALAKRRTVLQLVVLPLPHMLSMHGQTVALRATGNKLGKLCKRMQELNAGTA